MPFPKLQTRLRFHLRIRAARKRWCTSPPAPPATSLEHASMRPIRSNPPCPPHPASRLAEQRVERGIKASHRSEPGRRSTCEPNGGAAVRMCGGKRARTCATPAQLRASERGTPFFRSLCVFLAKLCDLRFLGRPANECQCACDHLSHERVGPVTQRRPQQHTRTQSHEQARAHLLLQQRTLHDCTPRKTGWVAWKRGLAR